MKTMSAVLLLMAAVAGQALAGAVSVPEIGMPSAAGAVSLLTGAVLVLRTRRRQ